MLSQHDMHRGLREGVAADILPETSDKGSFKIARCSHIIHPEPIIALNIISPSLLQRWSNHGVSFAKYEKKAFEYNYVILIVN